MESSPIPTRQAVRDFVPDQHVVGIAPDRVPDRRTRLGARRSQGLDARPRGEVDAHVQTSPAEVDRVLAEAPQHDVGAVVAEDHVVLVAFDERVVSDIAVDRALFTKRNRPSPNLRNEPRVESVRPTPRLRGTQRLPHGLDLRGAGPFETDDGS